MMGVLFWEGVLSRRGQEVGGRDDGGLLAVVRRRHCYLLWLRSTQRGIRLLVPAVCPAWRCWRQLAMLTRRWPGRCALLTAAGGVDVPAAVGAVSAQSARDLTPPPPQVDDCVNRAKAEGDLPLKGFKDPMSFVKSLKTPRRVMLLVMAGKPVDDTIALLSEHMEPGELTIRDGARWP